MINISFSLVKKNICGFINHVFFRNASHMLIIIVIPFILSWMQTDTCIMAIVQLSTMKHNSNQLIVIDLFLLGLMNVLLYV